MPPVRSPFRAPRGELLEPICASDHRGRFASPGLEGPATRPDPPYPLGDPWEPGARPAQDAGLLAVVHIVPACWSVRCG